MSARLPSTSASHRRGRAAVLVAVAALAAVVVHQSWTPASSSAASPTAPAMGRPSPEGVAPAGPVVAPARGRPPAPPTDDGERREGGGPFGAADGAVHAGVSAFDDDAPAVANLDPALRGALRRATTDAAADGVTIVVNSGWRSAAYQEHLLEEAIERYGSAQAASRWVAAPERSEHVAGEAVDLGPAAGAAWVDHHGARYGLCRIYDNERWHVELRPAAVTEGCPARYADPTHDPRLQP